LPFWSFGTCPFWPVDRFCFPVVSLKSIFPCFAFPGTYSSQDLCSALFTLLISYVDPTLGGAFLVIPAFWGSRLQRLYILFSFPLLSTRKASKRRVVFVRYSRLRFWLFNIRQQFFGLLGRFPLPQASLTTNLFADLVFVSPGNRKSALVDFSFKFLPPKTTGILIPFRVYRQITVSVYIGLSPFLTLFACVFFFYIVLFSFHLHSSIEGAHCQPIFE